MNFQVKHFYKSIPIIICCIMFGQLSQAQLWVGQESIYNEAEEYLHGEEYAEALPLYMLLEKKGISNAHLSYKIGKCYLNLTGRKSRAIPFLENAVNHTKAEIIDSLSETHAPYEAFILLGKAYRIDNQFDKAIHEFEKYKELVPGNEAETLMDYEIKKCQIGKLMTQNASDSKIEKLDDNSAYPLYNPVSFSAGKLFYMEKRPFYDAVVEGEHIEKRVENIDNLTPLIKSDGDFILVSAAEEGNTLVLIAYDAGVGYEIYTAKKKGNGDWQKPKKLPEPINTVFNETFAYISPNGQEIYFCSNRNGGFGGLDLYKSTKTSDGKWSLPVNLGNKVNTALNETSLYLTNDESKLFFASEGHVNMGGADFFVAIKDENGNWGVPVNLGFPISTTDNDAFLSPGNTENTFFTYRFDREKDDKDKIYKVHLSPETMEAKVLVRGKLAFSDTVPQRKVNYNVKDIDQSHILSENETGDEGDYAFFLQPGNYSVTFTYSDSIVAEQPIKIKEELFTDELTMQEPQWKNVMVDQKENILFIRDIRFGFDSSKLLSEYYPMLDSIFKAVDAGSNTKIVITGYSDSKGGAQYNLLLSEYRAKIVAEYFRKKGLMDNQITIRSKGESGAVAINTNPNGEDNPEGRSFNRRVTIELLNIGKGIVVRKTIFVPGPLRVQ